MSKFSRGASAWKEHRIADRMTLNESDYTVQLVALTEDPARVQQLFGEAAAK
jgi:hypothetical protein